MSVVVTVIHTFTTPAATVFEQRVQRVVELALPPPRGQLVRLPDDAVLHRIERVVQHARPSASHTFTPGWGAAAAVEVVLEPEDAAGLASALATGWTASAPLHAPQPVNSA